MANFSTGSNNSYFFLFEGVLYAKAWQDKTPSNQFKSFNQCVKERNFHIETGRIGKALLKPRMWAASMVLSDVYYHIVNILDNIEDNIG